MNESNKNKNAEETKVRMSIDGNDYQKDNLDLIPSTMSNEQVKLSSDVSPN